MQAKESNLLDFLRKSTQFAIPIYQRTYSWTERECKQLWNDLVRAGETDEIPTHFLGSVVYIQQGVHQVSNQEPFLVIDGQQRLTTVSLLLEALARRIGDDEIENFTAERIRSYYLTNNLEDSERFFKLLLTDNDRDTLCAVVSQSSMPDRTSTRVKSAFDFFEAQLELDDQSVVSVSRGLRKLLIVDVSLDRSYDNPQLIFESMNSTGVRLSQADLIRNFMLMGLETSEQNDLYRRYWQPMENMFGQEGYSRNFDPFMRDFLTIRTGEIPRKDGVYEAFKAYAHSPSVQSNGAEALIADILTVATHYCRIALNQEPAPELSDVFRDIRELKVDVMYPFLLRLYGDYDEGVLTEDDFRSIAEFAESYVFRRFICAIPTNSLNKTFSTFHRSIDRDRYLESVQAHFLTLPSYRRFPKDDEFQRELKTRDLYNSPRRSYWLRKLENHGRKERVPVDEYTIEHILPQNPNLSTQWQQDLGDQWARVQETYLHTLGNLTLTGYNSEYSDRPFADKRDMEGGFAQSPLHLNEGLGSVDKWNQGAIEERAKRLADRAVGVWPIPVLSQMALEEFMPEQPAILSAYTIDDHPNLDAGTVPRRLFDALRKEILALDPCVSEEYLKLYVAFKAETNFCDVVPQKSRLRLTLNMPFHALHDPRGVTKDIADLGRWGNGDVEAIVNDEEDIPYVMGLIRQSLELQMGDSGEGN